MDQEIPMELKCAEYSAVRINNVHDVRMMGIALNPRHDLRNHSPEGFAWGYIGNGALQLALALLANATGNDQVALALYHKYEQDIICRIEADRWFLGKQDILNWVEENQRIIFGY
jgi:hypothetical protein